MEHGCLCLLGDSVCKGVVLDLEKNRYVHEKASFGNLVAESGLMEVKNYSQFGCTISKGQRIAQQRLEQIVSSEVTILEFGGNDSDHNWAEIAADPDGQHLPNTVIAEFKTRYRQLISQLRAAGENVAVMNLPPIDAHKYFAWFSRGLSQSNILKWLGGDVEYVYRWHEIYNQQICNLCNELRVPLIDIRSTFLAYRNYSDFLCCDGIHPNAKGHGLLFGVVEQFLKGIGQVACA